MKEIRFLTLLFFTTVTACVYGQSQKPSGVYSLNGAQTVDNPNAPYPAPRAWIAFLCDSVIPAEIVLFNGAIVDGTYVAHDRAFFEDHIDDLVGTALTQTNSQLNWINDDTKGGLVGVGNIATVSGIREYLENNVKLEYVNFHLKPNEYVYLLGESGDWSGSKWVVHAHADGWYYTLTVKGKKYLLARASCFNNVSQKETFWFNNNGKATTGGATKPDPIEIGGDNNDPAPDQTHKVKINGKDVATTSGNGDVNITITGGNATVGDINVKGGNGGSALSNSESGGDNSGTTGTDGQNGRDGRDGKDGQNGANGQSGTDVPYPGPDGGNAPNYVDRSAQWAMSLGSRNYALYDNGQYAAPGSYQNGCFQPSGQVYQSNGYGGFSLMAGVGLGFLLGSSHSFNGGYCNGGWQSGRQQCWQGSQTSYFNKTTVNNTYVNNINRQNVNRTPAGGMVYNGSGGIVYNGTGGVAKGNTGTTGTNNSNTGSVAYNGTGYKNAPASSGSTSGTSPYRPSSSVSNPYSTQRNSYSNSPHSQTASRGSSTGYSGGYGHSSAGSYGRSSSGTSRGYSGGGHSGGGGHGGGGGRH